MTKRLGLLLCLIVSACGASEDAQPLPTTTTTAVETTTSEDQEVPTTEPDYDPEVAPVVEQAQADLASRLNVDETSIEVVSAESVTWPDGALGCPEPGKFYTQALVPGSQVVLEHDGQDYDYHAGSDGRPFLCKSSR